MLMGGKAKSSFYCAEGLDLVSLHVVRPRIERRDLQGLRPQSTHDGLECGSYA